MLINQEVYAMMDVLVSILQTFDHCLQAQQICDIYLKEYIKPNAPVPISLLQFVRNTHQGCVTDVRTIGDKGVSIS